MINENEQVITENDSSRRNNGDKPTWVKGMQSPNPYGRPKKRSKKTIVAALERFLRGELADKKLKVLYEQLTPREKVTFISDILPYVASKQPTALALSVNNLNDSQVEELYEAVVTTMQPTLLPEIKPINNGYSRETETP